MGFCPKVGAKLLLFYQIDNFFTKLHKKSRFGRKIDIYPYVIGFFEACCMLLQAILDHRRQGMARASHIPSYDIRQAIVFLLE